MCMGRADASYHVLNVRAKANLSAMLNEMRQSVLWALLLGAIALVLQVGAVWGVVALRARIERAPRGPVVYSPAAHPTTAWQGSAPSLEEAPDETPSDSSEKPSLPHVQRNVPLFDARVLEGCSRNDLDTVQLGIRTAIDTGAPMYNDGDFDGCYKTYEAAALRIERATPKACKGPASVLKIGREHAAKLGTAAEQAWAMRDAFDGLLDVIDRKGTEL